MLDTSKLRFLHDFQRFRTKRRCWPHLFQNSAGNREEWHDAKHLNRHKHLSDAFFDEEPRVMTFLKWMLPIAAVAMLTIGFAGCDSSQVQPADDAAPATEMEGGMDHDSMDHDAMHDHASHAGGDAA